MARCRILVDKDHRLYYYCLINLNGETIMDKTTKEQHLANIAELAEDFKNILIEDGKKMLSSGMVDVDKFDPEQSLLAKIVISAAIQRNTECYKPLKLAGTYLKSMSRNLIKM